MGHALARAACGAAADGRGGPVRGRCRAVAAPAPAGGRPAAGGAAGHGRHRRGTPGGAGGRALALAALARRAGGADGRCAPAATGVARGHARRRCRAAGGWRAAEAGGLLGAADAPGQSDVRYGDAHGGRRGGGRYCARVDAWPAGAGLGASAGRADGAQPGGGVTLGAAGQASRGACWQRQVGRARRGRGPWLVVGGNGGGSAAAGARGHCAPRARRRPGQPGRRHGDSDWRAHGARRRA